MDRRAIGDVAVAVIALHGVTDSMFLSYSHTASSGTFIRPQRSVAARMNANFGRVRSSSKLTTADGIVIAQAMGSARGLYWQARMRQFRSDD
jgi:hypothetical protein